MFNLTDCERAKTLTYLLRDEVLNSITSDRPMIELVKLYQTILPAASTANIDILTTLFASILLTSDRFSLNFEHLSARAIETVTYGAKDSVLRSELWFCTEVLNFSPWLAIYKTNLSPEAFVTFGTSAIYCLLLAAMEDDDQAYKKLKAAITADDGF